MEIVTVVSHTQMAQILPCMWSLKWVLIPGPRSTHYRCPHAQKLHTQQGTLQLQQTTLYLKNHMTHKIGAMYHILLQSQEVLDKKGVEVSFSPEGRAGRISGFPTSAETLQYQAL